jgi:hypothetical protein
MMLSGVTAAQAQSGIKSKNTPLWIRVMDDSEANYYDAQKDYAAFWKGKEKPEDEESLMSSGVENTKEHIAKRSKRELKEEREKDYYRYQCKRFENWLMVNKPYVQKDGRVLTTDERLKLWQDKQKPKQ